MELLDRALHFWYYHFYFSRWESLHDCTLQQVSWVLQFVAKLMLCLQALAMFVLTNMIVNVCLYLCWANENNLCLVLKFSCHHQVHPKYNPGYEDYFVHFFHFPFLWPLLSCGQKQKIILLTISVGDMWGVLFHEIRKPVVFQTFSSVKKWKPNS